MDAKTGINFLKFLLQEGKADASDIEKAIETAESKSPSASFDAAARAFALRHGTAVSNGYLAFAKGTRWLAVLRRDSGQAAFDQAAAELRQMTGGKP